jgi:hypothetical protein
MCVKDFIVCSGTAGVQYLETYAKLILKNVNKLIPKGDTNISEGSKVLHREACK